jgi:hypothetical protein
MLYFGKREKLVWTNKKQHMTLLNLHMRMIGITVNCMAVYVSHRNLTISSALKITDKEHLLLTKPLSNKETQSLKLIGKGPIIQSSETVCNEIKQMVTDASINASNLNMKDLFKISIYGNSLLN